MPFEKSHRHPPHRSSCSVAASGLPALAQPPHAPGIHRPASIHDCESSIRHAPPSCRRDSSFASFLQRRKRPCKTGLLWPRQIQRGSGSKNHTSGGLLRCSWPESDHVISISSSSRGSQIVAAEVTRRIKTPESFRLSASAATRPCACYCFSYSPLL